MKTVYIPSARGSLIPTDIYGRQGEKGLLLMAHSFISEKKEDGRFVRTGEQLAEEGYICLAPDFAGNGESAEDLTAYFLSSNLADMETVYAYVLKEYPLLGQKRYLLGYSMGGRVIPLFQERHPEFQKMVFWAALVQKFTSDDVFLEQDLGRLKAEADEQGVCRFYDIFNEVERLMSAQFINDLLELDALQALTSFTGEALIIQGDRDTTISPDNARLISENLVRARQKKQINLPEADHGFGLWDGRTQDNETLLEATLSFLKKA